ncbi:MAG: 4-(cytidine 5'-diphospho)-2-C-methyl-D-erythritol kinase [Synechococcaceae cyanobacterium SM2_3_60]|nr:4-(cytidine 5'-diphospho)-2-C-methyl-D-erythritol kinase [Synechococcaceae cyanobacterium SM2_3_60]
MQRCELLAPGKINLYLEITGKRADGYHSVVMVLQSVALADRLVLERQDTVELRCDRDELPTDARNLAIKAALLLQQHTGYHGGVRIEIQKAIPIGAGMAGGSADAAAVLVGLNQLWQLGLTIPELESLAADLGSDVPFCIRGGTVLAIGRGEQLSPLIGLPNCPLVIVKPRDLSVSTAWAYQNYQATAAHTPLSAMLSAIAHQDFAEIGRYLSNDLEPTVLAAQPEVAAAKSLLQAACPLGVMMSGSGPTVFALCANAAAAAQLYQQIDPDRFEAWLSETSAAGITLTAWA